MPYISDTAAMETVAALRDRVYCKPTWILLIRHSEGMHMHSWSPAGAVDSGKKKGKDSKDDSKDKKKKKRKKKRTRSNPATCRLYVL